MGAFIDFIREKGIVGLAVGFMMGGAISKLVAAIVEDIINPLIGLLIGSGLAEAALTVGGASIKWGHFLTTLIDFIVIAAVIYFGVKGLKLEKLDKKAETVPSDQNL